MPADPAALAAHATTLHSDSDSLAECAVRLDDIARRLQAAPSVPAWFKEAMDQHVTHCLVASTDLATAAARLEEYTSAAALPHVR
jgi:hypothetical protein